MDPIWKWCGGEKGSVQTNYQFRTDTEWFTESMIVYTPAQNSIHENSERR
jgi:hypothetical protein